MKVRKYQASRLDPGAVVVPIKDHEQAIRQVKRETLRIISSLNKAGRITNEFHDYWNKRIEAL